MCNQWKRRFHLTEQYELWTLSNSTDSNLLYHSIFHTCRFEKSISLISRALPYESSRLKIDGYPYKNLLYLEIFHEWPDQYTNQTNNNAAPSQVSYETRQNNSVEVLEGLDSIHIAHASPIKWRCSSYSLKNYQIDRNSSNFRHFLMVYDLKVVTKSNQWAKSVREINQLIFMEDMH